MYIGNDHILFIEETIPYQYHCSLYLILGFRRALPCIKNWTKSRLKNTLWSVYSYKIRVILITLKLQQYHAILDRGCHNWLKRVFLANKNSKMTIQSNSIQLIMTILLLYKVFCIYDWSIMCLYAVFRFQCCATFESVEIAQSGLTPSPSSLVRYFILYIESFCCRHFFYYSWNPAECEYIVLFVTPTLSRSQSTDWNFY